MANKQKKPFLKSNKTFTKASGRIKRNLRKKIGCILSLLNFSRVFRIDFSHESFWIVNFFTIYLFQRYREKNCTWRRKYNLRLNFENNFFVVNFNSGCEKSGEILPTWQKDGVGTKFSVDSTTGSLLVVNSSMDDSGIYERDNLF